MSFILEVYTRLHGFRRSGPVFPFSWHHTSLFPWIDWVRLYMPCISDIEAVGKMMHLCRVWWRCRCFVMFLCFVLEVLGDHVMLFILCKNQVWPFIYIKKYRCKCNDVPCLCSLKLILSVALTPTATSLLRSLLICNCSLSTRELQRQHAPVSTCF